MQIWRALEQTWEPKWVKKANIEGHEIEYKRICLNELRTIKG